MKMSLKLTTELQMKKKETRRIPQKKKKLHNQLKQNGHKK
jgi:hypothetical protein